MMLRYFRVRVPIIVYNQTHQLSLLWGRGRPLATLPKPRSVTGDYWACHLADIQADLLLTVSSRQEIAGQVVKFAGTKLQVSNGFCDVFVGNEA